MHVHPGALVDEPRSQQAYLLEVGQRLGILALAIQQVGLLEAQLGVGDERLVQKQPLLLRL